MWHVGIPIVTLLLDRGADANLTVGKYENYLKKPDNLGQVIYGVAPYGGYGARPQTTMTRT